MAPALVLARAVAALIVSGVVLGALSVAVFAAGERWTARRNTRSTPHP